MKIFSKDILNIHLRTTDNETWSYKVYPEHLQNFVPPNFDLVKYSKAANMDLIDWGRNIASKSYLLEQVDLEWRDELLEEKILESIEHGIIFDGFPTQEDLEYIANSDWIDLISVVRDLRSFEIKDKAEKLESIDETKDEFAVDDISDKGSYLAWLRIDMSCSDNEIVEEFSNWLGRARDRAVNDEEIKPKRRGYKLKKFSLPTLRKWHDSNILAYIDLVAWNTLKGNKITSKIIGDILFPNPRNHRDSTTIINDTVKPLVHELTSKVTLDRILKVAAERNRQKNT